MLLEEIQEMNTEYWLGYRLENVQFKNQGGRGKMTCGQI